MFPLVQGEKRPLWNFAPHGFHDATTEPEIIRMWFQFDPLVNIGMATGHFADVLDVDDQHGGWATLGRLVDERGCLPSTPVVLTPSGGAHFHFRPSGRRNRNRGLGPGLEWKGISGCATVPPSATAAGRYEWAVPFDEVELPAPPEWLVDLLDRPSRRRAGDVEQRRRALDVPRRDPRRYALAALEGEVQLVTSASIGERNHTLNRAAFKVAQFFSDGLLEPDDALDALLVAADQCGLNTAEARRAIASGFSAGVDRPRQVA